MMEHISKYRRMYMIKRSSLFLWILTGLVFTLLLFYRAEERISKSTTDQSLFSTVKLGDSNQSTDEDSNSIEYQPYYAQARSTRIPEIILSAYELNNTRKALQEILFFNRVPKVGSQTFMELMKQLAYFNEFHFHRDPVQRVEMIRLSMPQQYDLTSAIASLPPPSAFVKHVCYTNFTRFGFPMPIYINLVRDPVERVISWFYYVRAPWYFVERKRVFPDLPLPDPEWLKKDFETCVLTSDPECVYNQGARREGIGDHRRQSLFFCGHEPDCTPFNSQEALDKAKRAVEENYAVVGVLEDLNTTFAVLEHYVPRFFRGVNRIYHASESVRINRNAFKPPVSEYVKDIVRRNFSREVEFYEFCKDRLYKQYRALKLPTSKWNYDASMRNTL